MPIDWLYGLVGGMMIGLAAALYLLINGRIMGASGILGGFITVGQGLGEKAALIAGLILVPGAIIWMQGGADTYLTSNLPVLVIAGLCVGFGTRMANGCTSGHGVCGISRLSLRGIGATLVYLLAGAVSVVVLKSYLGAL